MTSTTAAHAATPFHRPPTLEQLLEQARHNIEVLDEELREARRRRDLISAALRREFPNSRVYVNGSVAHGDALTPLTDIDVGVVVAEAVHTHGPGKKGPADLQERAANAIRAALTEEFPHLRIEWRGRKRSILVRFSSPVTSGQTDFTADVIVAVDNTAGAGLYIPRYHTWDRAHPEKHTDLVHEVNENTKSGYARVMRLLKHWNRNNQKPLCSWNIKALGLGCITSPTPLLTGIHIWFTHAIAELAHGETEDPAGVAEKPIRLNEKFTRTEVVQRLRKNLVQLDKATAYEQAGYPLLAHEQLAKMFNDPEMLPYPDETAVRLEADRKLRDDQAKTARNGVAAAAFIPAVGSSTAPTVKDVRSWAP